MIEARILAISAASDVTADLATALSGEGYVIAAAGNLAAGVELLHGSRFDAVILDADICAASERAALLAGLGSTSGILLLPASARVDEMLDCLRAGWSDALRQPVRESRTAARLVQALRRALAEREKVRADSLAPLVALSETFLLNLDVDVLLEDIVAAARREADCDRVSLMLVEGREMRMGAAVGLDPQVAAAWRGEVGVGIAGLAAATGEILRINSGEADPRFAPLLRDDKIKSAISVPLKVRDKIVGVLNISNFLGRDRFYASDVRFFSLLAGQAAVAIQNANLYQSLQTSYLHTIVGLVNAIEARDGNLAGHSSKVVTFTVRVAERLRLPHAEFQKIRNAALLHDIGKIGIPDAILLKPGRLDDNEWKIMRTHPDLGGHIVEPVRHLSECVPLIRHHHERWDGTGYPTGLAGDEIPLGARIIAAADTYDAITSNRTYRDARGHEFAVEELRRAAGSQLDPDVVTTFLEVLEDTKNETVVS